VLGARDLYMLVEIAAVNAENQRRANERRNG
jgi:hypothetical protein